MFLETLSSQELVRALSERRITIFVCVPQFFYLIHERVTARSGEARLADALAVPHADGLGFRARRIGVNPGRVLFGRVHAMLGRQMRLLVTGGSKFDPAVGRDLYAMGLTILQAYGLTETSGAATITTPHEPISTPWAGRARASRSGRCRRSPRDVDGEVAIHGPIVMQGYFNRPDATAAVMRDGWLLTGDLGRLDARGRLTITGRKKEVIVLANGKNIYPEEIEAHYRQSPFVKEICVAGARRRRQPDQRAAARAWSSPTPSCCASGRWQRGRSAPLRGRGALGVACRPTSACSATTSGSSRCRAPPPGS